MRGKDQNGDLETWEQDRYHEIKKIRLTQFHFISR